MRSTSGASSRLLPRSLSLRVALGTAVSAAIVAFLAAAASLLIAEKMVEGAEDHRLRAMADVVAGELDGKEVSALDSAVAHEQEELARASIRLAVRHSALVGGDTRLPFPSPGECESHLMGDATLRTCTARAGKFQITTGVNRARPGALLLLVCCFAAAIVAALGAAVLAKRAARWALDPLTRLRDSVDQIAWDEPRTAIVERDDTCQEIATLRAALGSLLTRLADALDAARSFSADAAHELKTPLTVIRAELELLAEESPGSASREAVEKVRDRIISLVATIESLLAFATAADPARLGKEAVAIEDVVREAVAKLLPSARARIQLRVDAPGMVLGDETLLGALVENAIDNALKFSGDGSVEIDVEEKKSEVLLDVRDHGEGLPQVDRVRAFEPFFRTARSRAESTPGHGVGLALVARIAGAHKGTAQFVDLGPEQRGALLRIVLPAWSPQ